MGVHESQGRLIKAYKMLQTRWAQIHTGWNDSASDHFQETYLDPLDADVRSAAQAIDHMAVVLSNVKRDCE
jgi:uncharacterized protein YukE